MYVCVSTCRSWEEERGTLQAQIEALRRGAGLPARGRSEAGVRAGAGGNGGTDDEQRTLIQEQLNAALEREVSALCMCVCVCVYVSTCVLSMSLHSLTPIG